MKVMGLTGDTVEICLSPNKTNIKLVACKVPNELEMAMSWLVDSLQEYRVKFPRTIVYSTSINDTSKLYKYITTELPHCSSDVEMYHSETPQKNKDSIIEALKHSNSTLRIVLSTGVLGMGFDVKECQSVMIFGPPNNLVDMLQEIGRVGRDGNPSCALILYNAYHQRQLDANVKQFIKPTECRRQILMSNFLRQCDMETLQKTECGKHTCCNFCTKKCLCNSCTVLPLEKFFQNTGGCIA